MVTTKESDTSTSQNVKSTSTAIATELPTRPTLRDRLYVPESLYYKQNWIIFTIGVVIVLLYLLFPIVPEDEMTPHIFSPELTLWLQAKLGTEGIFAWFASIYYLIPFLTNITLFFVAAYFAPRGTVGRASWVYGCAIIFTSLISFIIYLKYPVAPPIRVPEHLNLGVRQIRMNLLPWSDTLITLKYNALPSGHIIYSTLGYLICREEGFTKTRYYYLINTIAFSFIILYLGEHYWFDGIVSIIVGTFAFFLFTRIMDRKFPSARIKSQNTINQ